MCLLLCLQAGASSGQAVYDRWYVIEVDDQPSGRMHETRAMQGEQIVTRSNLSMSIRRGHETIEISLDTEFIETLSGEPVRMRLVQSLSAEPTTITHDFRVSTVLETIEGPAGKSQRIVSRPTGDALTPATADAARLKALQQGQTSIAHPVFDPLSGLTPVLVIIDGVEPASVDMLGKVGPGWSFRANSSETAGAAPSIETLWTDGTPVLIEQPLGEVRVVLRLVEPEEATRTETQPAELLVRTFVTPSRPILRARSTTLGVYLLRTTGADMPDLPEVGHQSFERIDPQTARVRVDLTEPPAAAEEPIDLAVYIGASAMADSNDEQIRAFVGRVLRTSDGASEALKAERLRRAVHRLMTVKDLSAGFGSASEVIRTRTGDCTEHAVLLAACLRVADIPSRVASGLIYADRFAGQRDVFAFHMWTQALVASDDGRFWMDLDATLPTTRAFDATHITLGTDPLTGTLGVGAFGAASNLLGLLDIEVETAE